MARANEFWNDGGTDKTGSAGEEDTHILSLFVPARLKRKGARFRAAIQR